MKELMDDYFEEKLKFIMEFCKERGLNLSTRETDAGIIELEMDYMKEWISEFTSRNTGNFRTNTEGLGRDHSGTLQG